MSEVRWSQLGAGTGAGAPLGAAASARSAGASSGTKFAQVLDAKLGDELRFSAHAQARLKSREIPLTDADRSRLAAATTQAERKGAHEALLLMGELGFIVSVKSRTVITALDSSRLDGGIITGIDAAVVLPEV
jgi:flagellar operon protein